MKARAWQYGFLGVLALLVSSGCMVYQPTWPEHLPSQPSERPSWQIAMAQQRFSTTNSKEALLKSMDSFRKVLEVDPGNREAHVSLCNQYILLGAAYTTESRAKGRYYRMARKSCELAMYTNPDFKHEVDSGTRPWQASHTLEKEDAPAMLFWVTALQYEFKEVMSTPGKIVNIHWLKRALHFLDRITLVAPEYGNGAVEMAYAVCFCALPGFFGGDDERCYAFMESAVDKSEGYLLARWGRGRFFHQVTGDSQSARQDLQWVVSRDFDQYSDAYPWRLYFQRDARAALAIWDEQ